METINEAVFLKHPKTDIHRRGKACVRTIKGITENKKVEQIANAQKPHILKQTRTLTENNRLILLEYAGYMAKEVKEEERSLGSFEKNLSEAWIFALGWNRDIDKKMDRKQVAVWWEEAKQPYYNKSITWGTLRKKYECASAFLRWFHELKKKETLEVFLDIDLPKKPQRSGKVKQPSSSDIKKLLASVPLDGKRMSVRDQAILALLYDTGARIGEVLSMRENDLWENGKFFHVHFPESKTASRTVISYLAIPYLKKWFEVRPAGYEKDRSNYLFCQDDGVSPVGYASVQLSFKRALKKSGIIWKEKKGVHYLRALFSSRAFDWGYSLKHSFLGWRFKDAEGSYTEITPDRFERPFFDMLQQEKNALLPPEDLGIVENKESVYVDAKHQKDLLEQLVEGRLEEIEQRMVKLMLEKQKVLVGAVRT